MKVVYFSHSYRAEDRDVVEHFGRLLETQGLIVSLDPPSRTVNSAKLERHLASTDGMVAIFTRRSDGYSKHILYETHMCLRARKPLLAFIEDTLPDDILPSRVLQIRFSRASFLRQLRDHMYIVRQLMAFIGEQPPPRYNLALRQRCCGLTGLAAMSDTVREAVFSAIEAKGYTPVEIDTAKGSCIEELHYCEAMASMGLGIHFVDTEAPRSRYAVGLCDGVFMPTIRVTSSPNYPFSHMIPQEYQPRIVNLQDTVPLVAVLHQEMDLAEQDFLDLENQQEVRKYADLLVMKGQTHGTYTDLTRSLFVQELNIMGDKYQIGRIDQVAAIGSQAQASNVNLVKVEQGRSDFDLKALALELEQLRTRLPADSPGESVDDMLLGGAIDQARQGNREKVLAFLSKLGKGTLHVAASVGYHIAAAAIAHATGLAKE